MSECRAIATELRLAEDRGESFGRLQGYAAVFNSETKINDYTELIAPGAFGQSLGESRDVLALVDHDPGRVLARTRSGTLKLKEDKKGLWFDLEVPPTTTGRDVYELAKRGDVGGASFAFTPVRESWDGMRRTLEAVTLHEVSIVSSWPAYGDTSVQARSGVSLKVVHMARVRKEQEMKPRPERVEFLHAAAARRFLDSL